jgi:ubiquinone/menaquinone biosynthesis C-methylase UbiE
MTIVTSSKDMPIMNQDRSSSPQTPTAEIRRRYDALARWYDLLEGVPEVCGVNRLRRELLQRASGQVLEVAVGTGKNLRYYPKTCQITGVDLSPGMLARARKRADRLGLKATFIEMDAEALDFPGHSFDTVVDTLALCTFSDPVAVLREMARVCRSDGRILLLEHGRSDRRWLGGWQDRHADRHARRFCCHWNRQPLDLVRLAGLTPRAARRTFFGIFHVLEVTPIASPLDGCGDRNGGWATPRRDLQGC